MKDSFLNDEFFSRLEALTLELHPNLAGFFGGKHRVNTYGQTVEFADYREYMLGDDIRRIDWNLYSRFEKHYLKLFTDERQMHTQVILDCSASMGKDNSPKSKYAITMVAALGYLSVHNMDKVSFKLVQGNRAEDPFGILVGKRAFFHAISALAEVEFDGSSNLQQAIVQATDTGTSDGLSVIISDFFMDDNWKKAVDYLCYKKRQVLLIQVLTPEEVNPAYTGRTHLIDVESEGLEDIRNMKIRIDHTAQEAYNTALLEIQKELRTFCRSRGADCITICTDQPVEKAIFKELLKVGVIA